MNCIHIIQDCIEKISIRYNDQCRSWVPSGFLGENTATAANENKMSMDMDRDKCSTDGHSSRYVPRRLRSQGLQSLEWKHRRYHRRSHFDVASKDDATAI